MVNKMLKMFSRDRIGSPRARATPQGLEIQPFPPTKYIFPMKSFKDEKK